MTGPEIKVAKVFGVSNEEILSYIERKHVDERFVKGLETNKHIIIYGASKQGKTALTNKHLDESEFIRIDCAPNSKPIDIYKSILRQLKIEFQEEKSEERSSELSPKGGLKAKVNIPFLVETEIGGEVGSKIGTKSVSKLKTVEYNLELAQDISEILKAHSFTNRLILENFHYLDEEVQKQLAFDLRIFEDHRVLFVILGIWREKNRLSQFNGDLLDRVIEIPVEPWEHSDFLRVLREGEPLLNVSFHEIENLLVDAAFDSIGVFQELCKECCYAAGVNQTNQDETIVFDSEHLATAITKKLEDYSGRHVRSLESFVEQKTKKNEELLPLFLHYYFVKILMQKKFEEITRGLKRRDIHELIRKEHHRPDGVKAWDMSNFLHNLVATQIKKGIIPPIFDYDRSTKTLKVIDSTFYFFLKHAKSDEVLEEIEAPEDLR